MELRSQELLYILFDLYCFDYAKAIPSNKGTREVLEAGRDLRRGFARRSPICDLHLREGIDKLH